MNNIVNIKRLVPLFLLPLTFLLIQACPDLPTAPPKSDTTIHLEVLSTFTTTARLHISVADTSAEWTFGLTRNGEDVLTATVYNSDTTFTDYGLNPGTEYTYQARWLEDGIAVDTSLNVTAQTMDTTSHNFTWVIDTLGEYGSVLKDVWIVDDNNIWVVGKIETDTATYNAAHWDGSEWKFIKVLSGYTANKGIMYFSENDIWVTSGFPIHWNGEEWTLYHLQNMGLNVSVEHLWGTSTTNIYFVGKNGSIVHYDGTEFVKMESGTDIDLKDIWGVVNETTEKINIWVCGDDDNPDRSIVLTLDNGEWKTVYERYPNGGGNTIDGEFYFTPKTSTVWTSENTDVLWVAGGWGVYTLNDKFEPTAYTYIDIENAVGYFSFPWKIRGNGENDILVACENSSLFHFNGISWHWYETFYTPNTRFINVDIQSDFAVLAGIDNTGFLSKAFVMRGYR
jgi:hypothetical protein